MLWARDLDPRLVSTLPKEQGAEEVLVLDQFYAALDKLRARTRHAGPVYTVVGAGKRESH
jgi:hypothetical protein